MFPNKIWFVFLDSVAFFKDKLKRADPLESALLD
jgi:hypothetical protein